MRTMLMVVLDDGETYGPLEGARVVAIDVDEMDVDRAVKAAFQKAENINVVWEDSTPFIIHNCLPAGD